MAQPAASGGHEFWRYPQSLLELREKGEPLAHAMNSSVCPTGAIVNVAEAWV
jgi:hypothetical protein